MAENEDRGRFAVAAEFLKIAATDHILHEILLRLPDVFSVIECSYVCTRWRGLICDRNFWQMLHRQPHGSNKTVLFTLLCGRVANDGWSQLTGTKFIVSLKSFGSTDVLRNHFVRPPLWIPFLFRLHQNGRDYLDFVPQWQDSLLRASCNDLLLLEFPSQRLCVCNPMTRRWFELEKPQSLTRNDYLYTYALACDHTSGRGYRVVLFKLNSVSIYNSETKEWGEDLPPPPPPPPGVAENLGSIDWKMAYRDGVVYSFLEDSRTAHLKTIIAFNPLSGMSHSVRLPSTFHGGLRALHGRARIWVVRGQLMLSQAYWDTENGGSFIFRLWELMLHRQIWVLLRDVALYGETFLPSSSIFAIHPEDDNVIFLRDHRPVLWQYHIGT